MHRSDGYGQLRDWEIFNRPSKGSVNGYSHFGVKAEADGQTVDARVMNTDWLESRSSWWEGIRATTMCGVSYFRDGEFGGEYPLAELKFINGTFPGAVLHVGIRIAAGY